MSSEIIKRDENHVTVASGVTDDSDKDVTMLRVDPVTNSLLIEISQAGAATASGTQVARRDENHVPVCLAYNEDDDELQEVLTDENGYLLADIEFE